MLLFQDQDLYICVYDIFQYLSLCVHNIIPGYHTIIPGFTRLCTGSIFYIYLRMYNIPVHNSYFQDQSTNINRIMPGSRSYNYSTCTWPGSTMLFHSPIWIQAVQRSKSSNCKFLNLVPGKLLLMMFTMTSQCEPFLTSHWIIYKMHAIIRIHKTWQWPCHNEDNTWHDNNDITDDIKWYCTQ